MGSVKDDEDVRFAYSICAMEDFRYGLPLLARHKEEIEAMLSTMNERLKNKVMKEK